MIQMAYDSLLQHGDLVRDGVNFETGSDLGTAVLISLFTDRRAEIGDDVDPNLHWKGGWWGDTYSQDKWGSRLWLLRRAVATPANLARAKTYIEEALKWLIDDGVAKTIKVTTYRGETAKWLRFAVEITKPDGVTRWDGKWEVQFDAL